MIANEYAGKQLTEREMEATLLTGAGLQRKEVADRMHVSAKTVDKYLEKVYKKLPVRSQVDVAHWCLNQNLIPNKYAERQTT